MPEEIWTVSKLLNWTSEYFKTNGIENFRLDAEVLLAYLLKNDRLSLYLNYDQPLNKKELSNYRELILRRIKREPVSYIVGEKEFWSLKFKLDSHVLTPRPETEILVEEAIKAFTELPPKKPPAYILEIGTGCGAVAISLAATLKDVLIIATDISIAALRIAQENGRAHQVAEKILFLQGNLFGPIKENGKIFHCIISNPPYIPEYEIKNLPPEVKNFEPIIALNGGKDGLGFSRKIIAHAEKHLIPGGLIFLEIGEGQSEKIINCIKKTGVFYNISQTKDLSGRERVIKAQKMKK